MTYKYNQKLPKELEAKLDAYIGRIKAIKWFKPATDITKEKVDTAVKASLQAFGVEASIEYRKLKTRDDFYAAWDAARDAAWGAAWDAARDAAWDAARDAAWDAARDAAWDAARDAARDAAWGAAWDAAWGAAWDAAWGAEELLVSSLEEYKGKFAFLTLVDLWEMGMYPVGVVGGKFIVYTPVDFAPSVEKELEVIINGVRYVPAK